jgi:hypothetical protein
VEAGAEGGAQEGAEALPQIGRADGQGGTVLHDRQDDRGRWARPGTREGAQADCRQEAQRRDEGEVPALPPDGQGEDEGQEDGATPDHQGRQGPLPPCQGRPAGPFTGRGQSSQSERQDNPQSDHRRAVGAGGQGLGQGAVDDGREAQWPDHPVDDLQGHQGR